MEISKRRSRRGVFTKNCPECKCLQTYSFKCSLDNAIKDNDLCRKCSNFKSSKNYFEPYLESFMILYNQGFGDRQISQKMEIDRSKIIRIRKLLNLKPNNPPRKQADYIDENNIRCSRCKEIKDKTQYQLGRIKTKNWYKFSYCNTCRNKHIKNEMNNDLTRYFNSRLISTRTKARQYKIPFDLDLNYFIKLYELQNKKCFYTDVTMDCQQAGKGISKNSFSIDKIIPSKGYIKGNVVFCCNRINIIKNDLSLEEIEKYMPDWYIRIMKWSDYWDNNPI